MAAAFFAGAAFLAAAGAAFFAGAVLDAPLGAAGFAAAFFVGAVVVFLVVVAAATRAPVTSMWTEMPTELRCSSSPLR